MVANIERAYVIGKDGLSFDDEIYIVHGNYDPNIEGFDAPDGSIFIYYNGTSSKILQKKGSVVTDWSDVSAPGGSFDLDTATDVDTADETKQENVLVANGNKWKERNVRDINTLAINLKKNSYDQIIRTSGKVSNIINWTDSNKTDKLRELIITRIGNKVTSTEEIIYDIDGLTPLETITETFIRTDGKISSVERVLS